MSLATAILSSVTISRQRGKVEIMSRTTRIQIWFTAGGSLKKYGIFMDHQVGLLSKRLHGRLGWGVIFANAAQEVRTSAYRESRDVWSTILITCFA